MMAVQVVVVRKPRQEEQAIHLLHLRRKAVLAVACLQEHQAEAEAAVQLAQA